MRHLLSPVVAILVLATAPMQGQTPPAPVAAPAQPARAAAPASSPGARLPVRRVVLYKSGIGYFEHLGRVSGAQTVSIDLTSGQLDDVLKSLTTVDLGGGQVTGITYNTEAPLEEQLRKLRLPLGADVSRTALLEALRGRPGRGAGGGRDRPRPHPQRGLAGARQGRDQRTVDELTIVGEGGDVRTFELGPGVGVTIVEGELRRDLGQYLDVIGAARSQEVRRLQVAARGSGNRDLFVSYVSAVPVWKTTYRLVIPTEAGRKPFLQGWAIVDNTLGEDWSDVELSLVAGAPQSFIQPLSKPIYTERPVVPIQTGTVVAPEIHGGAMTPAPASLRGTSHRHAGRHLPGATVKLLAARARGCLDDVGRQRPVSVRGRALGHGDGAGRTRGLQDGTAGAGAARQHVARRVARGRLDERNRQRDGRVAVAIARDARARRPSGGRWRVAAQWAGSSAACRAPPPPPPAGRSRTRWPPSRPRPRAARSASCSSTS